MTMIDTSKMSVVAYGRKGAITYFRDENGNIIADGPSTSGQYAQHRLIPDRAGESAREFLKRNGWPVDRL